LQATHLAAEHMTHFQKIGIFGDFGAHAVVEAADAVGEVLDAKNVCHQRYFSSVLHLEKCEGMNDNSLDLAIAIGGDGTFLNVTRQRAGKRAPLLGINLGRRGFLTDVAVQEIEESMNLVLQGAYAIETRSLLETHTLLAEHDSPSVIGLNDVVVHKSNYGRLIDFDIRVDSKFVTSLRADGVIVSTPTGATAYALSAGGPVLHPKLQAIQIVPINPNTLTQRPIVLSDSSEIEIEVLNMEYSNASLVIDGHTHKDIEVNEKIIIGRAQATVNFIRIEGHTFFNALRQKLGWGI